jgi:hypothetical protein
LNCGSSGPLSNHAGAGARRAASPETIEEPKLRKRIVEMLSLHQTGVEAATPLSAFHASLPIKVIGNFRGNKSAMIGLLTPVLLSRRIQRRIVRRR